MAQRLLLVRYETGHSLRAVPVGEDPYTQGVNLTDHNDGFYSATLPVGVYDIYYKDQPDDPTWIPLEHYQSRFHPTDDITEDITQIQSDISTLDIRVTQLEGETPDTPQNVQSVRGGQAIHLSWSPQTSGTIYIVRGVYHHSDEQITVDENSRILYVGYVPEALLPNTLRFADIESKPFGDIELSFRIWAHTPAGTSPPTDLQSVELDLTTERAEFCESAFADCNTAGTSACRIAFLSAHYPGAFPNTSIDEQRLPQDEPARTISFHRDMRILRIEAESISPANQDCNIYFCDSFSGQVYSLKFKMGERFARSESTASGNPSLLIMRYPDSELLIYSDDAQSLQDVEIRLTLGVV